MAGFITVLTEALPAGLLDQMSRDLNVSQSMVGQLVTLYAFGTMITAIPLTSATQGFRRRPVLLVAIGGFVLVNTVTAVSTNYVVILGARFLAGVFAGLLWALIAGYAGRMAPDHLRGRAMAVAMIGIPLALSLGIPAGTFIGAVVGWRVTFAIMSVLALVLIAWGLASIPDFPGQKEQERLSLGAVFRLPGIRSVLFVTLAYVLAHNILYTYIVPFVAPAELAGTIDAVLLIFGLSALAGIWITGVLIDRWLRELVLVSTTLFALVALAFVFFPTVPAVIYAGVCVWGVAYGGVPTLLQTASAKTAGDAADVAQSMIVTVWNVAIAGGGLVGGALLDTLGVTSFPQVLVLLLVVTFVVAWSARSHGFQSAR